MALVLPWVHPHFALYELKPKIVTGPILFIGYEPSLHDEIREFLRVRRGEAFFAGTAEETIRVMDSGKVGTVVLLMERLEDAAILRYINLNYQGTRVLIMPGKQLEDAIPVLASGKFELLHDPFTLEELKSFI